MKIDLLGSAMLLYNILTALQPSPPPPFLPASVLLHSTTLVHLSYLGLLGHGAQGVVYRVHDKRINSHPAFKVLKAQG
jgi:hypothetical protein